MCLRKLDFQQMRNEYRRYKKDMCSSRNRVIRLTNRTFQKGFQGAVKMKKNSMTKRLLAEAMVFESIRLSRLNISEKKIF